MRDPIHLEAYPRSKRPAAFVGLTTEKILIAGAIARRRGSAGRFSSSSWTLWEKKNRYRSLFLPQDTLTPFA